LKLIRAGLKLQIDDADARVPRLSRHETVGHLELSHRVHRGRCFDNAARQLRASAPDAIDGNFALELLAAAETNLRGSTKLSDPSGTKFPCTLGVI